MATKLGLYNLALGHLGEQLLTTETDPYSRRRELDNFYPLALSTCLEAGQWNFAARTVYATADATSPSFGWQYQFTKPTDWVRTMGVSTDEYLTNPLTRYEDEVGVWLADVNPLYFRYVSNHATLGGGLLTAWPATYEAYVAGKLAELSCLRITQDKGLRDRLVNQDVPKLLKSALAKDAMNGPPRRPPTSNWVRARGSSTFRYDRG